MDKQALMEFIAGALASGCGAVITWAIDQVAAWVKDNGKELSPKAKRRLALLLCVVAPTVLYLLQFALTGVYEWYTNLMVVGLAFITNQMVHGETQLQG